MSTSASVLYSLVPAQYFPVTAATAGSQAVSGSGVFYGIQGLATGTTFVVTIYDNTAASGNQLLVSYTVTAATTLQVNTTQGISFSNGLFIVVTGTPGAFNILYNKFQ